MTKDELERRTKAFAVDAIRFAAKLPQTRTAQLLAGQFLRAATSIGANYREANRAESRKDFVHKIAIVEKEAAEALYWIEIFQAATIGPPAEQVRLYRECDQIVAIFTRIGRTAKLRDAKSEIRNPKSAIPE